MKKILAMLLFIHWFLPIICLPQGDVNYEINQLLKSEKREDHEKAIERLKNLSEPDEKTIQTVFYVLKTPHLPGNFSSEYCGLLVKWGKLAMPCLLQALNDKEDFNHRRAPGLIRKIAAEHGAEVILPAVPGLIACIKEKDFEEKHHALWALAELKELADDAVTPLTEEMIAVKDTDINWSFLIAQALVEIAGSDYPPIQPFLKKEAEYSQQHINVMDENSFKLEKGFDISRITFAKEKIEHVLMVSPAQLLPAWKIKYRDIVYEIAYDKNKIQYIATSDINFRTDEGFMIGDTVQKLKESGYSEFSAAQGWGYFITLKYGWSAGFCLGDGCTAGTLTDDSKIDWFFK